MCAKKKIFEEYKSIKANSMLNQQQTVPESINRSRLLTRKLLFESDSIKTNEVGNQNGIYANCININVAINSL